MRTRVSNVEGHRGTQRDTGGHRGTQSDTKDTEGRRGTQRDTEGHRGTHQVMYTYHMYMHPFICLLGRQTPNMTVKINVRMCAHICGFMNVSKQL